MSTLKIFAEIGIGNETFLSTEIEKGKLEHRVNKLIIPPKIESLYIRVWFYKRVYALSTNRFFNTTYKGRVKFKFLFGIEGKR